jgi:hypothetical protein
MKNKHYAILSKKDNFLYGAFDGTKEGLKLAKKYLKKINNNKIYYIKKRK